jgi:hypothetical protein
LENVKGFGSKSVKKVRPELTVDGLTNVKPAVAKASDKKHDLKK